MAAVRLPRTTWYELALAIVFALAGTVLPFAAAKVLLWAAAWLLVVHVVVTLQAPMPSVMRAAIGAALLLAGGLVLAKPFSDAFIDKPFELLSIDCRGGRAPHPDQILTADPGSVSALSRSPALGPFAEQPRLNDARLGDRSVATCRVTNNSRLRLSNVVVTFAYRIGSAASTSTDAGSSTFPVVVFRMIPPNGGTVDLRFDNASASYVRFAPALTCAVQLPAEESRRRCNAKIRNSGSKLSTDTIALLPGL